MLLLLAALTRKSVGPSKEIRKLDCKCRRLLIWITSEKAEKPVGSYSH